MSQSTDSPAWLERSSGERIPVTGNCALGRAVGNDVVLVDDRVSRRHATIHSQGSAEFLLVDLGSRNGTYLNGQRVSKPTRLRGGDHIQVGPFVLVFQSDGTVPQRASLPGHADQTQLDLRSAPCWLLLCDIVGSSTIARHQSSEALAMLVGGWFARCKEVVEDNGGAINKYLGDALFAYWHAREEARPHVAQVLRDLRRLQDETQPPFRVVVHHGAVLFGGIPSSGEESLAGNEVNFVFRLERLASKLRSPRLLSAAAVAGLGPSFECTAQGELAVEGFDGVHSVFSY